MLIEPPGTLVEEVEDEVLDSTHEESVDVVVVVPVLWGIFTDSSIL